jgi:hypothetical protein
MPRLKMTTLENEMYKEFNTIIVRINIFSKLDFCFQVEIEDIKNNNHSDGFELNIKLIKMKKLYMILVALTIMGSAVANINKADLPELKKRVEKCKELKNFVRINSPLNISKLKSTAGLVTLDSIIQDDGIKYLMQYNNSGLLVDFKSFSTDELAGILILEEHKQITYDNAGNQTLLVTNVSDGMGGMYVSGKTESIYDAKGRITSEINWLINGTELLPETKTITTYGESTVRTDNYDYKTEIGDWKLKEYSISTFDDKNQETYSEMYSLNDETGEFDLNYKIFNSEFRDGEPTVIIEKSWDSDSLKWVEVTRTEFMFDNNGYLILERVSINFLGINLIFAEISFAYNSSGLPINMVVMGMDLETGGLSLSTRYDYIYSDGKLIEELNSIVNSESGDTIVAYKYEFSYENDPNSESIAIPDGYFFNWSEDIILGSGESLVLGSGLYQFGRLKKVKYSKGDGINEGLSPVYEANYYYSGSYNSSAVINKKGISAGPNPFVNELNIQLPVQGNYQATLYNSLGGVVCKNRFTKSATIVPSSINKGIYILEVKNESGVIYRSKYIKQ